MTAPRACLDPTPGQETPREASVDDSARVRGLVDWYRAEARDLPWRRDPTPYKVLLSELMLQQTRVETALPYFQRFLARWPALEDLAAAEEHEVVEAWAGLGYYRRARHLHQCARAAVAQGGLPADLSALRQLPGVGPYTAGAIGSIAFGLRVPLVDGNVERVLCRLDGLELDPRGKAGRAALWARAGALQAAHQGHPGDLNQALMELGARLCTPRSPFCGRCPLRRGCVAREAGTAESLPRKAPRQPPTPCSGIAGLLHQGDRVLLGRRAPGGLLGGLWEPLRADVVDGETAVTRLTATFRACGLEVEVGPTLGDVVHVFTHRRLTCALHPVALLEGDARPGGVYDRVRWVRTGEATGLSGLARKLLRVPRALPSRADLE